MLAGGHSHPPLLRHYRLHTLLNPGTVGVARPRPARMAQDEAWDRAIRQHYHHYLGQPERSFTIDYLPEPTPNPITILEFSPSSDDDCWAYATVGASRLPKPTPEKLSGGRKERIELVIFSDRP